MTDYNIQIKRQKRKSLAMKVTPAGLVVSIPYNLDTESSEVQTFIRAGLQKLSEPKLTAVAEQLSKDELYSLVDHWGDLLGVEVQRVQLQPMSNKWGSISTAGNLTLASDLLDLPSHLVEYVICHELLHLKVFSHTKVYRLLLSQHLPDWRERELELGRRVLAKSEGL